MELLKLRELLTRAFRRAVSKSMLKTLLLLVFLGSKSSGTDGGLSQNREGAGEAMKMRNARTYFEVATKKD